MGGRNPRKPNSVHGDRVLPANRLGSFLSYRKPLPNRERPGASSGLSRIGHFPSDNRLWLIGYRMLANEFW